MSNPSDFQTKLEEILRRVGIEYGGYDDKVKDGCGLSVELAKSAILTLIRESLPPVQTFHPMLNMHSDQYKQGKAWNDYRDAVLEKLQ